MSCLAVHVLCVSLVITHTAIYLVIIPRSSCLRCTIRSCRCNAVARLFCCCLLQTETLAISTATVGATRSRTGQSFARTTSETIHAGAGACVQSERRERREEKRKEERISGDFKQQQQQQQQPKLHIPVVRSHNPRFEHSTIACAVFVVVASSNHAAP